jgi:hypothetical protein
MPGRKKHFIKDVESKAKTQELKLLLWNEKSQH